MSWETLDTADANLDFRKRIDDQRAAEQARAKLYSRLFESEDGQKVMADLTERFVIGNSTALGAVNVNYEAAYHNGESGVVRWIIQQLRLAKEL
jgi:hypothetical protein